MKPTWLALGGMLLSNLLCYSSTSRFRSCLTHAKLLSLRDVHGLAVPGFQDFPPPLRITCCTFSRA